MSREYSILTIVVLLCWGLLSCGSTSSPARIEVESEGEMSIAIPLSKRAAANIASAEIVVSATGMEEIRQALTVSANSLTGTVRSIPAGTGRQFTIEGYNSSGSLTYTGSALATVTAGQPVTVRITVRPVGAVPAGPVLVVLGTPQIVQGWFDYGEWYNSDVSESARIAGEIENTGSTTATNVTITVTLRDPKGNLLGRIRNQSVENIEAGDSALFVVIIEDVFSDYDVNTSTYQLEVDISHD